MVRSSFTAGSGISPKKGTNYPYGKYRSDMTLTKAGEPTPQPPLRLWPGVVAVTLQWFLWFVLPIIPIIQPQATIFGMLGGVFCGLVVLIWWAFFSRVPHFERWGAIVFIVIAVAATPRILHPFFAGAMVVFRIYVIPGVSLALVAWAV